MAHIKYKILLALFLISLVSSLILSLIPTPVVCDPGVGCDVVKTSSYNFTLGIKNSYYGVIIFALGAFLIFSYIKKPDKNKKLVIHTAIILGSLIAVYFLYIQAVILQAYCKYCLIVDFSMIVALIITLFWWKE